MYFDQRKSDILIKQTHKNISARQSCRLVAQSFFFLIRTAHFVIQHAYSIKFTWCKWFYFFPIKLSLTYSYPYKYQQC